MDSANTPHSPDVRRKIISIIEGPDNRRVCFNLMANTDCSHGRRCKFLCHHNIGQA
jgi:hypothetical protein